MKTLLKIIGELTALLFLAGVAGTLYFNRVFPRVSPAENIKIESNAQRINRGKYLVENVCDCFGCHSTHDFQYFGMPVKEENRGQGGFLFDHELMGLPGKICSRNITPYNLKDWTDGEIVRALRVGMNKQGKALFNLMPYQQFSLLCQEDLYSIIAYLRNLKPIVNDPPQTQLKFPVNLIVKTVPRDAGSYPAPQDKKNIIEYGRYMPNAALCADCHTP